VTPTGVANQPWLAVDAIAWTSPAHPPQTHATGDAFVLER
jgi:hypothetical protein